jgi:predicted RNase H-like nuclease (RuvC/YqgF family)
MTPDMLSAHGQAVYAELWQEMENLRIARRNYAAQGGTSQARYKRIDAQIRRLALHMEALFTS